jgi:hypothetical protein
MAHLHTFEITYLKDGKEFTRNYTKFCRYPKKTKLFKEIKYLMNNNLITEYKIF